MHRLALCRPPWCPLTPAPVPRRRERAAPDAAPGKSRAVLCGHIGSAVLAIGECPAVVDRPSAEVLEASTAEGDNPAIAVGVAPLTGHVTLVNELGQG